MLKRSKKGLVSHTLTMQHKQTVRHTTFQRILRAGNNSRILTNFIMGMNERNNYDFNLILQLHDLTVTNVEEIHHIKFIDQKVMQLNVMNVVNTIAKSIITSITNLKR